jgi:hypothetical protein
LSIDPAQLGCDPERVHVVWSMSKDLAASGVRLVCLKLSLLILTMGSPRNRS